MSASSLRIYPAGPDEVATVHALVLELARYEKLEHEVQSTPESLRDAMFGPHSTAGALLADWEGEPAGVAVYFHNFSTFTGRPGLYLEDIFVRETHRRRGIGLALLKAVAGIARDRDCGRMEWTVLDWNESAIRFYESLGAQMMGDWRLMRVNREGIQALAE